MHFLPHQPPHPIAYKSFEIYWTFFFFRSWNSLKISTQYVSQWPPGLQQTSWIDFPGLYKDGGRMTMESQALTWLKLSSPSVPVHSVTGSTRVYQRQISTICFQACYSPICSAWMEDWEQVLAPVMGIVVVLHSSGKKIQFSGRPGWYNFTLDDITFYLQRWWGGVLHTSRCGEWKPNWWLHYQTIPRLFYIHRT